MEYLMEKEKSNQYKGYFMVFKKGDKKIRRDFSVDNTLNKK
jgi:hypothetical protein